jgi:RimJ/RimL family protein N-acetyltransferase
MWCADKFKYPLTIEQLADYKKMYEEDEFGWSFTALNEEGVPVGHFLMTKADYKEQSVHLGFIIIDDKYRGKGYGKEMVRLAVKYAYEILGVRKVTLGVFDNNPAAHYCYQAAGFEDTKYHENLFSYKNEKWGLYEMISNYISNSD